MTLGPVADYLPHRPPMLLVDELVDAADGRVTCRTTLRPDCVFARAGRVHASAMIEVVAQACAICGGLAGPVKQGMVVACKEATFTVDDFAIGDVLTIEVTRTHAQPPLTSFTGTVSRAGTTCVTMQLSVVTEAA